MAIGDSPLISPNGATVAVAAFGTHGAALRLYPSGGGAPRSFFNLSRAFAYPVAWSANSRYLAVELTGTSVRGTSGSGLAVIDTRTLAARVLARGAIERASFAPSGDRLVYASTRSPQLGVAVNLHTIAADGSRPRRITSNGHSFSPVWTRSGIVFTRDTLRGFSKAPIYQLWLLRGSHAVQLTHMKVPPLLDGLEAVSAAGRGGRLIAHYVGEDTDEAWTVQLKPLRVRRLLVAGKPVQGYAISRDGRSLLVDAGRVRAVPQRRHRRGRRLRGRKPDEAVPRRSAKLGSLAGSFRCSSRRASALRPAPPPR